MVSEVASTEGARPGGSVEVLKAGGGSGLFLGREASLSRTGGRAVLWMRGAPGLGRARQGRARH